MTIKEVADIFKISEHTIRYYEKEGMISNVERKNNIRNYSEDNLNRIEFIVCMRNAGVSIEALKKYIALYEIGEGTEIERKNILINERNKLRQKVADMNKALSRLEYKINNYDELLNRK